MLLVLIPRLRRIDLFSYVRKSVLSLYLLLIGLTELKVLKILLGLLLNYLMLRMVNLVLKLYILMICL